MLDFSLLFPSSSAPGLIKERPSFKNCTHSFIHPEVFIVYFPTSLPILLLSGVVFHIHRHIGLDGRKGAKNKQEKKDMLASEDVG